MNPYFALSAIFALGLRGIEKKLELNIVPVTQMTQEDKRSGKVGWSRLDRPFEEYWDAQYFLL